MQLQYRASSHNLIIKNIHLLNCSSSLQIEIIHNFLKQNLLLYFKETESFNIIKQWHPQAMAIDI